MYKTTTKKHLWYKYENDYYKVPTNGMMVELIDFGRSIYKFGGKQFCSDSFGPGGDGSTQYNCEPNPSFDLCRLGCSIYDFLIDQDMNKKLFNDLQRVIDNWVTDDNGHIFYTKRVEKLVIRGSNYIK